MRTAHRPVLPQRTLALAFAGVWAAAALGGCFDDGVAGPRPLSLMQAHERALPEAQRLAPSAHLIGFVGHEGPAPDFLRGLLAPHIRSIHTGHDVARNDGRAFAWTLLFANLDGDLVRVDVDALNGTTDAAWAARDNDATLQTLWGLNLGGRLLVDSPAAAAAVLESDAAIARHVRDHPYANIVYASTVTDRASDVGTPTPDLAYEIFYDYGTGVSRPYAFYAQVSHWSGRVLLTGDHAQGEEERTVTLVEEDFQLNPTTPSLDADQEVPEKVFDAVVQLEVRGNGGFTFEIRREGGAALSRIEETLVTAPATYTSTIGTLLPGTYTLHAEATGSLQFGLRIDGVVVL